jgi:hypothetical protein
MDEDQNQYQDDDQELDQDEPQDDYEEEIVFPFECPDGVGYVGRDRINQFLEKDGVQFFLNPYTGVEIHFRSRDHAIKYLRTEVHYSKDDLKYFYWYVLGEDEKRDLLTESLIKKGNKNAI